MTKITINLVNKKEDYYIGDTVEGVVEVKVNEKVEFKTLYVEFEGKSKAEWSTGSGLKKEYYDSSKTFLQHKHVLLVSNDANDNKPLVLQQGSHEFPFAVVIPDGDHPSTFEGKHGSIKYKMRVEMVRSFFPNITESVQVPFQNHKWCLDPALQSAVELRDEKHLCCCCCKSGPISLAVVINKTGFHIGESIKIDAEIENHSDSKVKPSAYFVDLKTFKAEGETKKYAFSLAEVIGEKTTEKQFSWKNIELKIPQLEYLTILGAPNVRVEYYVEVRLKISDGFDLVLQQPIILGLPFPKGGVVSENLSASQANLYPQLPGPQAVFLEAVTSQPQTLPPPYNSEEKPLLDPIDVQVKA